MNKLLLSVAACAMLAPFGAIANEAPKTQDAKIEAKAAVKAGAVAFMPAASFSAKELLGEGVDGANGDRIARVDDIVIDANGRAQDVIVLSGGFFGLGGKRGALDFRAVDIAINSDYEPDVSVSLNDEGIKAVAEYVTNEVNDYSLASELLGAEADLMPGGDETENVVVNDIIINPEGDVDYLIGQKSAMGPIGAGDKYAVAFNKLKIEQGDGGLILTMTEAELDSAPKFNTERTDIAKAWDKTKESVKDAADKAGEKIDDAAH